jgi:hypothetical protein
MAGIFQSMLYGMNQARGEQRQRAEDEYVAGERQYQQQRRGVTDQREDTSWQDSREDRQYEVGVQRPLQTESAQLGVQSQRFAVGRQPVEAQQQDAQFQQGMEAGALSNQAARFSVGRMPIEARQQDARFGVDMQSAQQGIVGRQLQLGSARRAAQIEEAQQPGKLDEIRLERERKAAMDELGRVGQRFMLTGQQGKKQDAAQLINQTWAKATGDTDGDAGVRVNEQGQYYLEGPDGRPLMMLGDEDQVMQYAFTFLSDPTTFAQSRQATYAARAQAQAKEGEARASNPQRFTETVQRPDGSIALLDRATGQATSVRDEGGQPLRGAVDGRSGQMPARLQEVEAIYSRLRPLEGESEDDRYLRAYSQVTSRAGLDPDQAAADFYETVMRGLLKPDLTGRVTPEGAQAAQQQAAALTEDFRQRFLSGRSASGLRPGPTAAPAPDAERPQRTGTDPATGRRVGMFADGSIRFID